MSQPSPTTLKCPNCGAGMRLIDARQAECDHCGAVTAAAAAAERAAAELSIPRLERDQRDVEAELDELERIETAILAEKGFR